VKTSVDEVSRRLLRKHSSEVDSVLEAIVRRVLTAQLTHHHHHHGEDGSRPERTLYPRNRRKITNTCYRILEPCSHEEADTRIIIHVADCVAQGYQKISIRTIDTDVVVLAVSVVASLDIADLWVAFGTGKSFRHIGAHNIASNLGQERSACLPLFHSLTGCDTVSSFTGRGKKSCWDVWGMFKPLTQYLLRLASLPVVLETDDLSAIQRFVVLLYSRTCGISTVNEARKHVFAQGSRSLENIPPTIGEVCGEGGLGGLSPPKRCVTEVIKTAKR